MRFVKSPAQVTAEQEPPPTGPVTVPVEHRVLSSTLVVRGQVGPARSVDIRAAGGENGRSLVTRLPVRAGDEVRAGQVVAEVSGRPVLVLPGEVPAYRDILPGARGGDVTQLQDALTNLGYGIGADAGGLYGTGTKDAVAALYADVGYEPSTTGPDDAEQVRAAERRVRDATDLLESAVHDAPGGQSPAVAVARQAVTDATEDLAVLVASTGVTVPYGEIVFVPTLPARIDAVRARVGDESTDALLTLAVGDLVVRAVVPRPDNELLRPGQPVEILSEILGKSTSGTVASVGAPTETPAAPEQADSRQDPAALSAPPANGDLELVVHGTAPLAPEFSGQDVRLTIEAASTEGEVLVVPLAAVSARGDGQAQVVRVDADGREERLVVTPGVSGNGYVQVTAESGGLDPGDLVVVGR